MPLRPSQVETLRAVAQITSLTGCYRASARSVGQRLKISEAAAYRRMYALEGRRFLASSFGNRRIAFYLTPLGIEALEGSK